MLSALRPQATRLVSAARPQCCLRTNKHSAPPRGPGPVLSRHRLTPSPCAPPRRACSGRFLGA